MRKQFEQWMWWTLVLTLAACGRGNRGPRADQGDFTSYVEKFEQVGHRLGRDLRGTGHTVSIEFGEVREESAYGECRWHLLDGKKIVINESRWNNLDETSRESLIFHELGHCALGRQHEDGEVIIKHSDSLGEIQYPKSLMNAILVGGTTYEKHREYYEKELFGK